MWQKINRGMFKARLLAHRGTEKSFCKIMPIPPAPPMTILKGDKNAVYAYGKEQRTQCNINVFFHSFTYFFPLVFVMLQK